VFKTEQSWQIRIAPAAETASTLAGLPAGAFLRRLQRLQRRIWGCYLPPTPDGRMLMMGMLIDLVTTVPCCSAAPPVATAPAGAPGIRSSAVRQLL